MSVDRGVALSGLVVIVIVMDSNGLWNPTNVQLVDRSLDIQTAEDWIEPIKLSERTRGEEGLVPAQSTFD